MRRLRIAQPTQLSLALSDQRKLAERWWDLPEPTRQEVVALLARLIARSVVDNEGERDE